MSKLELGSMRPITKEWISALLEEKPEAIALHGRTLKQQYSGLASWEEIAKAVEAAKGTGTLILGNGDVNSYQDAIEKVEQYGVDGVLIGRGSFGNPFVFKKDKQDINIFEVALEHCKLYEETYKDREKNRFLPMRKHLGWYVKGISNAKEVRMKLFRCESSDDVEEVFKEFGLI